MTTFRVEISTTGREVYIVYAEDAEEAARNWFNGSLLVSEVLSYEVVEIEED